MPSCSARCRSPTRTEPNDLIYLTYAGGAILAVGLFVLGIGLLCKAPNP